MKKLFACLLLLSAFYCYDYKECLKIGAHVWIGYEPIFIYSQVIDKNKSVHLIENSSASRTMRSMQNNIIDVGMLTLDEAIMLKQYITDLKVIYFVNFSNGADVVLSKANIKSISEIKGKRIGVENTALGSYYLQRVLEIHNITDKEISIIPLDASQHEVAFQRSLVDVLITYEPMKTSLVKKGANILFDSSMLPGEILDVVVVKKSLINDKKKQLVKMLEGFNGGLQMLTDSNAHALDLVQKRQRATVPEIKQMLDGIKILGLKENTQLFSDKVILTQIDLLADSMFKNKLVEIKISSKDILDSSVIEAIHE
jgi:NitT/TauT family transport system substrate-binding protein